MGKLFRGGERTLFATQMNKREGGGGKFKDEMSRECPNVRVDVPVQDYKSLRGAVMICATSYRYAYFSVRRYISDVCPALIAV